MNEYLVMFGVIFGEILIVTIAQYVIFKTHRIDKSLAFLAAIQLIGSKLDFMEHHNISSLGEAELELILVNIITYTWWSLFFKYSVYDNGFYELVTQYVKNLTTKKDVL